MTSFQEAQTCVCLLYEAWVVRILPSGVLVYVDFALQEAGNQEAYLDLTAWLVLVF